MRKPAAATTLPPALTELQQCIRALAWLPTVSVREICAQSGLSNATALLSLRTAKGSNALCSVEWALRAFMSSVATRIELHTPMGRGWLTLLPASTAEITAVLDKAVLSQMYAFAAMKKRTSPDAPLAEFREDPAMVRQVKIQAVSSVQRTIERTLATLREDLRCGEIVCDDLGAVLRDLCQRRSIGVYELSVTSGASSEVLRRVLAQEGQVSMHLAHSAQLLRAAGWSLRIPIDRTTYIIGPAPRPRLQETVVAGYAAGSQPVARPTVSAIADPQLRRMVAMALEGKTNVAIGAALGCTRENVRKRIQPYIETDPHANQRRTAVAELRAILERS